MCGIAGFIDYKKQYDMSDIYSMTDIIQHRGPDGKGALMLNYTSMNVALGHRRLSIIDLSETGSQPMSGYGFTVIFNGEIYNYKNLKQDLVNKGYSFKSESDTEVILASFKEYGVKCVEYFIGMFTFAIVEDETGKMWIFRDRLGVKPLYYSSILKNGLFIFGSELKSFISHSGFDKKLNFLSVRKYLRYGYVPAPLSIFRDVYKLRPGHYLEIENKNIKEVTYWDCIDYYNNPLKKIRYKDAVEEMESIMIDSFKKRMVSDVPTGVFLSGGYDSTLVTALLQKEMNEKLSTFTVGFDENEYDESGHAQKVAEIIGTNHTTIKCDLRDALSIIPDLPKIYDEPISDNSCIPTYLLSREVRKHVKVVLSADGGDEIFGGYDKYYSNLGIFKIPGLLPQFINKLILKILQTEVIKTKIESTFNGDIRYENLIKLFSEWESGKGYLSKIESKIFTDESISRLLKKSETKSGNFTLAFDEITKIKNRDLLDKLFAIDLKTFMVDDILVKVDRASMYASLEARDPLIDHRIVEYGSGIPSNYKFRNGKRKSIIKDIVHKYVPKDIMDRPKKGFTIPLKNWIQQDLKPLIDKHISTQAIKKVGVFDVSEVMKLKNELYSGNVINTEKIWRIFVFQQWASEYGIEA